MNPLITTIYYDLVACFVTLYVCLYKCPCLYRVLLSEYDIYPIVGICQLLCHTHTHTHTNIYIVLFNTHIL